MGVDWSVLEQAVKAALVPLFPTIFSQELMFCEAEEMAIASSEASTWGRLAVTEYGIAGKAQLTYQAPTPQANISLSTFFGCRKTPPKWHSHHE